MKESLYLVLLIFCQHYLIFIFILALFGFIFYGVMQIANDNERLRRENKSLRDQLGERGEAGKPKT
ncbi:MAG: hypothetical protein WC668_03095 [Patescibacteria group bacterium]|jgi:flagellar biogenesis protein FliO